MNMTNEEAEIIIKALCVRIENQEIISDHYKRENEKLERIIADLSKKTESEKEEDF